MGMSGRHTEGETDRAERTAEGKRETEQEAIARGREGEGLWRNGQRWRDGCSESAEDRRMTGRT